MTEKGSAQFGDKIIYDLSDDRFPEVKPETSFVIGETLFSKDWSHVVVAHGPYIGMPINAGHCKIVSRGHEDECARLRQRYLDRFPGKLKDMAHR
jgi:hypothetical protein